MIAAMTLFLVLTLSVAVIRVSAVALRLTGLPEDVARFQARSAFTGAGFTTSESEVLVNHPLRRRIISYLMVTGNLGLVSVLATVIVSLVGTEGSSEELRDQLLWLSSTLILLWLVMLNPLADRMMCGAIGRILSRSRRFSADKSVILLQMSQGHAVMRFQVGEKSDLTQQPIGDVARTGVAVLGLRKPDGRYQNLPEASELIDPYDEITVYGPNELIASLGNHGAMVQNDEQRHGPTRVSTMTGERGL